MMKSTVAQYQEVHAAPSYLENVTRATIAFLAALLAIAPVPSEVKAKNVTPAATAQDRAALLRLASQYDSTMPNLASELRHVAGRD